MKVGRQVLWNVTPICETSQICYLMGKRPMKDGLGNHFLVRFFHLVRASRESINLERKSHLDCSSDMHCTKGVWEFGKVTADLEELETVDGSEFRSKRLNTKDVIFPKEEGEFILPIADGRSKTLGGGQDLRTSTLVRHRPIQGERNIDFLGESEGVFPLPQDSLTDAGEAINVFCSMSGNFICRHHVESRVKLYSPREESFPIPLKYIDVSSITRTNLDVKQEKLDDYWNIDGSGDLSDPWTGFTQFTLFGRKSS